MEEELHQACRTAGSAVQTITDDWPASVGQHEDYLRHALTLYRDGERTNAIMMPMATNLTDPQIKILAKYYASMKGLETTVKD